MVPAPAGRRARERLVMDSTAQLAQKEVGGGVAGESEVDEQAILKGVRFNVHLLGTESAADEDFVLAAANTRLTLTGQYPTAAPSLRASVPPWMVPCSWSMRMPS